MEFPNLPDYVRVDCPELDVEDCLAHPHELQGDFLHCRIELDEDHSAVRDAYADGVGDPEFIQLIHISAVQLLDGTPFVKSKWYRDERTRIQRREDEYALKMAEAKVAAATERIRNNRPPLPELDWGIRHRWF